MNRYALLTAHYRHDLDTFATELHKLGFAFVASRGTAAFLRNHKLPVEDAESITGYPPLVGKQGIKLIHPKIFSGILADPENPDHVHDLEKHGIHRFEIVVCNFYPFEETLRTPGFTHADALHNLDIGGPAMVRCAAKNYRNVIIITDPADYTVVLKELRAGNITNTTRQYLALKAFAYTKQYDELIISYLQTAFQNNA